ncbi:hypothetical protein BDV95DRAFT_497820 [Massariosphaeria phaeospora]|uniref:Nudix hydrolase domain-containing protein n=1 Tax=Massariosphaeria phaeospora TaxID=100035 RepID=A0A7C8M699_9PLEO|nr:hypothetical protein BDV95DRAFT_497820 [Massariosphaeria phaeospora]
MAQSSFPTRQFSSEDFVESCGAILFHLSSPPGRHRICLVHYLEKDEWLLAKGRRNCGESRKDAAAREVTEETGYRCHILPLTMATRAPSVDESAQVLDQPRVYPETTEPFMCTIRELEHGSSVKLVWWYIAALDDTIMAEKLPGEAQFEAEFFSCEETINKLTYQTDRNVVAKAVQLVKASRDLGN